MTSFIAACGSGRSTSFIPAVPAAWSVTTIAFIVHLLVCGVCRHFPRTKHECSRGLASQGSVSAGLVAVGPPRIDPLHSDVQRHAARPILDISKQHPAHRGSGGGGIRGHWIERRGLELEATDELACERDEDQREIAGSEGVAMVLLAVDHPPLRVQERLGPIAVAVSQVEDEVMHLHKTRVRFRDDPRSTLRGSAWDLNGATTCHGDEGGCSRRGVAQTLDRSSALR